MGRHEAEGRGTNRDHQGKHRVVSTKDASGVRTDRDSEGRLMGYAAGRGVDGELPEDNYNR
jgi:hypothetical protein